MLSCFLDANVILEVLLKRRHYADASAVLRAGENHRLQLYSSFSVIGFVAYWMIKDLRLVKAKAILIGLLDFVHITDISHEQLLHSLQSDFKDIEDGIQYYTALQHRIDYFITLNKSDFLKGLSQLKVVSPAEMMKIVL